MQNAWAIDTAADQPLVERMRGWLESGPVFMNFPDADVSEAAAALVAEGFAVGSVVDGSPALVKVEPRVEMHTEFRIAGETFRVIWVDDDGGPITVRHLGNRCAAYLPVGAHAFVEDAEYIVTRHIGGYAEMKRV